MPALVPSPVHWSTTGSLPAVVHAGTQFQATLVATIDPGWHLYASQQPSGGPLPLVVSIAREDTTELMRVNEPHARYSTDPQYGVRTAYFEQTAKFTLYLQAAPVKNETQQTLHMYARYQACNDRLCLPPQEAVVILSFRIKP
ncbi:MAG: protein-disulfide reductase DsbD domain-containing protein [Janthinobacterium lividum]